MGGIREGFIEKLMFVLGFEEWIRLGWGEVIFGVGIIEVNINRY